MSNKTSNKPMMRGPRMGGPGGYGAAEKPKDFKGTLLKTLRYMRKDLVAIIVSFVLAIGGVVATLLVPDILGGATDKLMSGVMQKSMYKQLAESAEELEIVFNDELKAQIPAQMMGVTMGELKELAAEDSPLIPEDMREMLKELPDTVGKTKLGEMFGIKDLTTIGELTTLLGMDETLDKIPDSYRAEVAAASFRTAPQTDVEGIVRILLTILAIVAASGLVAYLQGYVLAGVGQRISYRFRDDINKKLHKLPLRIYDKTTNGEIMSLITNDVDTISMSLNQSLSQLLTSLTTVVGVMVMMFRISWVLTLVAIATLPVTLIFVMLIVKSSQKYFIRQQQYLGRVNGHIEEQFSGHNVVKLFNGEEDSIAEFQKYNRELYQSAKNSQFFSGLMQPLSALVGNLGFAVVCIVGGVQVISGNVSIGNVQAFIQYIRQFNQPITQVASVANTFQSTIAAAERVFGFLELEDEAETGTALLDEVHGDVAFRNVRFGYNEDRVILKDFSCDVKQGQRVAIVGPTGAGKTTIVKLLMRFYDLNAGSIEVDGLDIAAATRESLRRHVGMVLQDTWLFNGTIMENIRYGRLDASDEEVIEAAKIACADHFINTLPKGYQFEINADAGNVSQGQKQLITIARAILADPKILILDEATSSVDTRTEVLIQQAMEKLMEGRTSFIIAHRLSTIRNADKILVLREGDVVEQGSHAELLAQNGFYAELYNSQFDS